MIRPATAPKLKPCESANVAFCLAAKVKKALISILMFFRTNTSLAPYNKFSATVKTVGTDCGDVLFIPSLNATIFKNFMTDKNLKVRSETVEVQHQTGSPLAITLDLINEDSNQPRSHDSPGFSEESLEELAASIRLRGVKTPISVRENAYAPGRFIINHGARRYRASRLAGKATIPGFIDNDYNEADQVVENLQRNALTAREIANFVGREMAKGFKNREIAQRISKSPAFVTQHATLLDLPDPIADAFNAGRIRDVTTINELVLLYKKMPREIRAWTEDPTQEITRVAVKLLRRFLESKYQDRTEFEESQIVGKWGGSQVAMPRQIGSTPAVETLNLKNVILQVTHQNRTARLLLGRRVTDERFAWLKYEDDGEELEVELVELQLLALRQG